MERSLVVHQITAMDVPPMSFVRMAAQAGCRQVSVFTSCPDVLLPGQSARLSFPVIAPADKQEMLSALADDDVNVDGLEYFPILPDIDVAGYRAALALGAELGGSRAVCHIHDPERARAVHAIGLLCEMAAAEGLSLGVEFTPMTRGCPSLEHAVELVAQVGRSDFAIGIDCLHLVRSGGTAAELAQISPNSFSHLQLCDGHGLHRSSQYMSESHDRELPGKGDFPLGAILSALPPAIPVEIEVPSRRYRETGVSAAQHIAIAANCARAVLQGAVQS